MNLDIVDALVAELRGIEDDRALDAGEAAQLDKLELLRDGLRIALLRAQSAAFTVSVAVPLIERFTAAHVASQAGRPIAELLGMQGAIPRGRRWRPLRLGIATLAWLGTTRIVDDLRLICSVGEATPERPQQLALMRGLQAGPSRLVELARPTRDSTAQTRGCMRPSPRA